MQEGAIINGKYTLAELRISKGYNFTWYAEDEDEYYVLKFIRYQPINAGKVEKLRKIMAGLDCKNIVKIYETFLFEDQGKKYLVVVTEFFKKGSVLRKIRNQEWNYDKKLRYMFHAACGV